MSGRTPMPPNSPSSDLHRHPDSGPVPHRIQQRVEQRGPAYLKSLLMQMPELERQKFLQDVLKTSLRPEIRNRVISSFNAATQEKPLTYRTLAEGQFVYVIKVNMIGTEEAALVHVLHERRIEDGELKRIVDEAMTITTATRLKIVREQLAGKGLMAKLADINSEYFPSHIGFFETVLVDKFGFKKMALMGTQVGMEETIVDLNRPQPKGESDGTSQEQQPTQADDPGDGSAGEAGSV